MGTLRLIFALSVVLAHSWPGHTLIGGPNAVRLFYMISGFLISYILTERKSYHTLGGFYLNRYLRLYPTYLAVALLALGLRIHPLMAIYSHAPAAANGLLAFSNIFIFGQDWVMFAGVKRGALVYMTDFHNSDIPLFNGLLVPQAWTLGLELTFYAMAPFVLPRRRAIWAFVALSFSIRIALIFLGLWNKDPWSYRFFPAELFLFLVGALAHQIGLPYFRAAKKNIQDRMSMMATSGFALLCFCYPLMPGDPDIRAVLLVAAFVPVLPLSFIFQSNLAMDRKVGALSYPLYIGHVLVVGSVEHFAKGRIANSLEVALICVGASLVFAYVLDLLIVEPFEKLRTAVRVQARHGKNQIQSVQ